MTISRFATAAAAAALFTTCAPLAVRAATTPAAAVTPPTGLIRLPNGDYTVPMRELQGSGTSGRVTLHAQGPKTIVSVYVFGNPKRRHTFRLHSGRDCSATNAGAVAALPPTFGGQRSSTIVSLPISNLTSKGYVIDANDATGQRQFAEACAQLR